MVILLQSHPGAQAPSILLFSHLRVLPLLPRGRSGRGAGPLALKVMSRNLDTSPPLNVSLARTQSRGPSLLRWRW